MRIKTFRAKDSYLRAAPTVNSQLALVYRPQQLLCGLGVEIKFGYEADYYFKALDRINPLDGFIFTQDPVRVKTSSNLGVGGPFVQFSIAKPSTLTSCWEGDCCCFDGFSGGLYGAFTSSWLRPIGNNNDLVYATLNKRDGSIEKQEARSNYSWSGTYELGWKSCDDVDLKVAYFHLNDHASTSVQADNGEKIFSVNASGPAFVAFSEAQSRAEYDLDQVDCLLGTTFSPVCNTDLHLSFGVRYAHLQRKIKMLAAKKHVTISELLLAPLRSTLPSDEPHEPNAESIEALEESREEKLESYKTVDDFWKAMGIDPDA